MLWDEKKVKVQPDSEIRVKHVHTNMYIMQFIMYISRSTIGLTPVNISP